MALDDLIDTDTKPENEQSSKDEKQQDNTEENHENKDPKELPDKYCPSCKTEGEDTEHWYYRCTTPSNECPVVTFLKPKRE